MWLSLCESLFVHYSLVTHNSNNQVIDSANFTKRSQLRCGQVKWLAKAHRPTEEMTCHWGNESRGCFHEQIVLNNSDFKYPAPLSIMASVFCFFISEIWSLDGQNLQHRDFLFPFLVRGESKRGTMVKSPLSKNWSKGHWLPCVDWK